MKRALRKDFYMEIRRNLGRFLSIFFIVAMGVAFYSGIQSAAPDMRHTGDAYFDENNLMDLKVIGTMGITGEDVETLAGLEGVKKAEPGYMTDVLCGTDESMDVLHMETLPETLNKVTLEAGRLPEKAGECFLDSEYAAAEGYQVGDILEVKEDLEEKDTDEEESSEESGEVLKAHRFTITGIGNSPVYISFSRGSTTLGTGEVSGFLYVTEDSFDMEVYTQVYLEAEGSREASAYTEEYDSVMERAHQAVEDIEGARCKVRYQEIQDEANEELDDARKELADKKEEADKELADAKAKIDDAQKKLDDGRKELEDGKKELEDAKAELNSKQADLDNARAQIASGRTQLSQAKEELTSQEAKFKKTKTSTEKKLKSGEKQIKDAKDTLKKNEKELEDKKKELEKGRKEYEAGKAQAEEAARQIEEMVASGQMTQEQAAALQAEAATKLAQLETAKKQLDEGEAQIASGEKQIKSAKQEIKEQEVKIADGRRELEEAEKKIADGWAQIASQEASLNNAVSQADDGERQIAEAWQTIRDNEKEIADGEQEIADHEQELADGNQEYEDARREADEKIADAQKKIDDAQSDIDDLKVPEWKISDRDDLPEYTGYGENADRMKNIGEVFPVLFFLVAALISLTTMTRMVEEQRTQIGTLKALGYGKFAIASKYMFYALAATLGGSVFGVFAGEKILPFIIINAYGIMYHHMPDIVIPYNMQFAVLATGAALVCTLGATVVACYHELAATPAILMRPPAPKQGKRVLLERVTILWRHLSFTWKSTLRNLFRYKKRFLMTIFGIGGCMALILVGFGLRDSIMDVAVLQYQELQLYDGIILLDEDADTQERQKLSDYLEEEPDVSVSDTLYMKMSTIENKGKSRDTYLMIPGDTEKFSKFVDLRDRLTGEEYALNEDGIILTEKTASMLDVSEGDTVRVELSDDQVCEMTVAQVCENYMGHYAYMTSGYYEKITGEKPEYNSMLYRTAEKDQAMTEQVGQKALTYDAGLSVSYTGTIKEQVDDMLGSLDVVIVVLIVSAGMLAFVVLYNLNNININERKRELATIKVLGFYDGEVSAYVYRENILLTVIGAVVGVVLGIILHRFVIVTVEIDACMFGRNIYLPSFLYAILFTFGFSLIVNIVMHFKLKKIDMVESLKSVE